MGTTGTGTIVVARTAATAVTTVRPLYRNKTGDSRAEGECTEQATTVTARTGTTAAMVRTAMKEGVAVRLLIVPFTSSSKLTKYHRLRQRRRLWSRRKLRWKLRFVLLVLPHTYDSCSWILWLGLGNNSGYGQGEGNGGYGQNGNNGGNYGSSAIPSTPPRSPALTILPFGRQQWWLPPRSQQWRELRYVARCPL